MSVEVLLKPRQTLRRSARLGAGLAGDGLLIRLRSTTIAMLGVVAAVGLALVAVALQAGWPSVLSGPLPQAPAAFARNATIVAPALPARSHGSTGRQRRRSNAAAPAPRAPTPESELTAANPVESPAPGSPPASHQPQSPESQSHGTPSNPAPVPSPEASPAPTPDHDPAPAAPPAKEGSSPPVVAAPESSPGHSGESHGHHYGGGPPPWAGHDDSNSSSEDDSWDHGHGHDDDHDGGWGHH